VAAPVNNKATDVIIVGGGLMGASTALFLRHRGRSVRLIERGLVGQQASGVNFGNIRRQGRRLDQLPLSNRARAIWQRLPELVGENCEYLCSGQLRVSYEAEGAQDLEAYAREAREYGLELEIIGPQSLRRRYPWLGHDIILGSLAPEDGHANPRLTAPAFGRAALKAGALIEENTEVQAIEKSGEDFQVQTVSGDSFRAPIVMLAAGAWAAPFADHFGEPIPLVSRGPQMGVTEPVPYRIKPSVGVKTRVPGETVYLRQVERGNIVFGGGMRNEVDLETNRVYPRPEYTLHQLPLLRRLMPGIEKLRIIRVWSGIEGYLPDDQPVMGPSDKVPGLYYAFGFSGAGFQIGPGVGDVMAELIATGASSTPIDSFHIRRFAATT